jgi:hypothetical protein
MLSHRISHDSVSQQFYPSELQIRGISLLRWHELSALCGCWVLTFGSKRGVIWIGLPHSTYWQLGIFWLLWSQILTELIWALVATSWTTLMFSVILMLLFLLVLRLGCWNLIIGSLLHLVADKRLSRFLIILDLYRLRILINFVRRGLITGWSLIASSVQVLLLDVELSYGSEIIFNLLLIRLVIFDFLLIGASN